ncbi:hypothetical protein ScPMuIL_013131 [Solemya velum]
MSQPPTAPPPAYSTVINPIEPGYPPGQPQYGAGQPQYGAGQPQYGAGQPPQYGAGQPQYGAGKPSYGAGQPQYGGQYNGPENYGGHGMGQKEPEPVQPHSQSAHLWTNNQTAETDGAHTDFAGSAFNTASFSDKAIRHAFIKKVYLILMTQLLITFAFICMFSLIPSVKQWLRTDGAWCYYVSYGTFLVTYFVLVCCPSVRRKFPGNFICLLIFTLAFSYLVGTISSFYDTGSVFVAAGITAAVCLSISLFAIQTKIDFTMCTGLLFALMMVLIFFGFSCLIVYYTMGYNRILDAVWRTGGFGILIVPGI